MSDKQTFALASDFYTHASNMKLYWDTTCKFREFLGENCIRPRKSTFQDWAKWVTIYNYSVTANQTRNLCAEAQLSHAEVTTLLKSAEFSRLLLDAWRPSEDDGAFEGLDPGYQATIQARMGSMNEDQFALTKREHDDVNTGFRAYLDHMEAIRNSVDDLKQNTALSFRVSEAELVKCKPVKEWRAGDRIESLRSRLFSPQVDDINAETRADTKRPSIERKRVWNISHEEIDKDIETIQGFIKAQNQAQAAA